MERLDPGVASNVGPGSLAGTHETVFRREGPSNLGSRAGAVNSLLTTIVLATGCYTPRTLPVVPAGAWSSLLGDARRSAYAAEAIPLRVSVAWRASAGRGIVTALQVHDDVIVATTTSRSVVTLSTDDGSRYWSHGFEAAIAGSVLKKDERVIAATGDRDRRVHVLDIRHGKRLWSRRTGEIRVEPTLASGRVVIAMEDGEIAALAETNGEELWRTGLGAGPVVPPLAWGGAVVIATRGDSVFSLDLEQGRIIARRALRAPASAPALARSDTLLLPQRSGHVEAFTLPDLRPAWRAAVGGLVLAAPVPAGDGWTAVLTREAEVWRIGRGGSAHRIAALSGAATGSLTAAANGLIVGKLDGSLTMLDFDGHMVWRIVFDQSIVAPVAVRRGSVYVPLMNGDVVKLR